MMDWIRIYFEELYYLLLEMSPWLLLGFTFAGILHVFMPEGSISRYMGTRNLKSVFYGALLGVPLPLCSCGVIPTGISFHKEGASRGATISFLISTPQTGVDSILATYSMLGLPFALIRPVVALLSGIFGGWVTNISDNGKKENTLISAETTSAETEKGSKLLRMVQYAYRDFMTDIADWLIIGFAVAALISAALPDNFFTLYLNNELLSMLIVLVAAVPLYVCATGSIPIAAVLMMKGLSPGAALVFLMAGPATNVATMTVIGKVLGRKSLFVYLFSISLCAVLFGWLINNLLPAEWFTSMLSHHATHEHQILPQWFELSSAITLVLLLLNIYYRRFKPSKEISTSNNMSQIINNLSIEVGGMNCNHCKVNVEKAIKSIEGIESVTADPHSGEVIIAGQEIDLEKVKLKVEDIGYDYKGVWKR
jgi:uncharacterized membrane protein YraQ (UPF0718 family)/copper chaperone CopZ